MRYDARMTRNKPTRARDLSGARGIGLVGTLVGAVALVGGALPGCAAGERGGSEDEIRRAVTRSIEREVERAREQAGDIELSTTTDLTKLEIREDHLEQIQREYSADAYVDELGERSEGSDPITVLMGRDLMGAQTRVVEIGLGRAVRASVRHNLDVEFARYAPAISQAQLVRAQAVFDWTLFGEVTGNDSAIPQTSSGIFGSGVVRPTVDGVNSSIGLRKQLTTGGTLSIAQEAGYRNQSPFFGAAAPNPSNNANLVLDFNQPLLDGFGRSTALSQVRLARNAERSSVADLESQLIDSASETERAYWRLVLAYRELVIRAKLLERGIEVRENIRARRVQDASQAQVADAVARVERRRSDLISARTALRNASDALKRLINDPRLPVGSELLLIPSDEPSDEALTFSLLDAINTAVRERPELDRALLTIDDASIRETVARNARLPTLDLVARARLLGLEDSQSDAFDDEFSGRLVDDWLLGLTFEQPLGNRAGEAGVREARLERLRSIVGYRRAVQGVVLEVKNALNAAAENARLIGQTRLSRVAQGEVLRTLRVEKELTNQGYTVERLNLELNQQESLASAEIAEAAARVNYNISLVDLYAAMGTTLGRNRIDFVVPDANQLGPGESVGSRGSGDGSDG